MLNYTKRYKKVNGKAIAVTGRGNPQGCQKSRFPHFLDLGSQMAVRLSSLRAGRPLPPRRSLALIWLEGLGQVKKKQ
jgi:hypothetical protein